MCALQTSCSLLLSAFADGHEISSPRYHSSIMDIFLNDSLVSIANQNQGEANRTRIAKHDIVNRDTHESPVERGNAGNLGWKYDPVSNPLAAI